MGKRKKEKIMALVTVLENCFLVLKKQGEERKQGSFSILKNTENAGNTEE